MPKPVLVVMAAGMGSRFGGLKQIQPVGPHEQALMDYSLYDARRAGFEEAVFIISPKMARDGFEAELRARVGGGLAVRCAVQDLADVPEGTAVPDGRAKPWGTGHAVRACRGMLHAPFAVINADDYYGPGSFAAIHAFLSARPEGEARRYAMVGYQIHNTLSESGSVARGVCRTDADGRLVEIHERTHIIATVDGALYTENGQIYHKLPDDTIVSMNIWGFTADFMAELDARFTAFLARALAENPLKGEYFLPEIVGEMLREGQAAVDVLPCHERWYGVTYQQDLPEVRAAIAKMTAAGLYPERLWG